MERHGCGVIGSDIILAYRTHPIFTREGVFMCADGSALTGFHTLHLHRCDLYGDGDYRLVVADQDRKLKVYGGEGHCERYMAVQHMGTGDHQG